MHIPQTTLGKITTLNKTKNAITAKTHWDQAGSVGLRVILSILFIWMLNRFVVSLTIVMWV